ncbi:MAG: HEAT repeat domain-containing protein [Verrucomicrobia bacterium]|nr:HEAT repeat domain-containing protein [Verrucomicrobiota bacterium]
MHSQAPLAKLLTLFCFCTLCAPTAFSDGLVSAAIEQPAPDKSLIAAEEELASIKDKTGINKLHILYLLQSKEFNRAIDLYQEYKIALGRHDFEILQQMGLIILEQGARSSDPETQLTSIFGSSIAGIAASIDILEAGIASPHPQTQMASIQFLGHLQDDRCEELLTKAMSSDYFFTRMEAAYQLAVRKSRTAVGQIESLMYKVPPQMRFFFAQFFALIGTSDAIALLRHMMDDQFHMTRIEAILSAARFGRDDLLPMIRSRATHLNIAEQEACATAIGYLKDSKSVPLLKNLSQSPSANVKLAAKLSLYNLGVDSEKEDIIALAKEGNLFAISMLGNIPGSETALLPLIKDPDLQVRFNAVFALLKRGDPRVLESLLEFLIRDSRDLGFQPQFSVGNSLMAWKVIPSAQQHQQDGPNDLLTLSLSVREHMLRECLELSPNDFLKLAGILFDNKQGDLIPLLIGLMENLQTPEAVELLTAKAQTAGAPLTRAYCNLALLRLKKGDQYKTAVLNWISMKKNTEMIRFRPMLPWNVRISEKANAFELTPEEHSRLLIECYQTIAMEHDDKSIDIILEGLKSGHSKNRSVLAGLLIQAIQ